VPKSETEYRLTFRPLTAEEGGGYLIELPDLPGCISDGETITEALANGAEAKRDWIAAMRKAGRPVSPPTMDATEAYSGKWVLRTPKSLHRSLAERARQEGVSLNTLGVAMLAQGLGQRMQRDG
jgi:antitoxin HicB